MKCKQCCGICSKADSRMGGNTMPGYCITVGGYNTCTNHHHHCFVSQKTLMPRCAMDSNCNFSSGNDSDCANLFDGVHVSVTAIQALFAATNILVTVPTNLLLIAAMITQRSKLDSSVVLAVSFLFSNIIVSVFLCGEIFITSITRAWVFGYWGCQTIGSIVICGLYSRWIGVGLLSMDRFCRVFFPYSYPRMEKNVVAVLLLSSWLITLSTTAGFYLSNGIEYSMSVPGCMLVINLPMISPGNFAVQLMFTVVSTIIGIVLPTIFYTALYIKGRKLSRIKPALPVDSTGSEELLAQMKSKKANITYSLMIIDFVFVNVLIFIKASIENLFRVHDVPRNVNISIKFLITTLIAAYVIGDLVIILSNSRQREVFMNLLSKIYKLPQRAFHNSPKI